MSLRGFLKRGERHQSELLGVFKVGVAQLLSGLYSTSCEVRGSIKTGKEWLTWKTSVQMFFVTKSRPVLKELRTGEWAWGSCLPAGPNSARISSQKKELLNMGEGFGVPGGVQGILGGGTGSSGLGTGTDQGGLFQPHLFHGSLKLFWESEEQVRVCLSFPDAIGTYSMTISSKL